MDARTVVITIREYAPLCVSASRLTADSSVFRYLIDDLELTELELEDFVPEVATLFLTLLEDKTVDHIEDEQFRELHKLSVAFKVEWLIDHCRNWLIGKIEHIDSTTDYDTCVFLFEECLYIVNKWNLRNFAELLTLKLAQTHNSSFISRYIMGNYEHMKTNQLNFLLKVAGSNTKIVLKIIIEQIEDMQYLDESTKFLLQNMNLPRCLEQNDKLYQQMFEKLSAMSEMSRDDVSLTFRLMTESTREAASLRSTGSTAGSTVFDISEWLSLNSSCNTLEDITRAVTEHRISNMFDVVEILVKMTLNIRHQPSTEEAEVFVDTLANICCDHPINRASSRYIDMWISALRTSNHKGTLNVSRLLEMIKENDKLSSYHDNVHLVGKKIENSSLFKKVFRSRVEPKLLFEFHHPDISHCEKAGKCGFILQWKRSHRDNMSLELSKEEGDYEGTRVHYHDVLSVEDMYYYEIRSGTTQDGTRVSVPTRGRGRWWWSWWLPRVEWDEVEELSSINYNVRKYLVNKH